MKKDSKEQKKEEEKAAQEIFENTKMFAY